jgi:polyphosphate kinase
MQNDSQTTSEKAKLKRKEYEEELSKLQIELCKLQEWVRHQGVRVIVIFEGRDGAGKGGTIKAITARVSPRVFRVVALPAPSDREKTQIYLQRYMEHFPAAGEKDWVALGLGQRFTGLRLNVPSYSCTSVDCLT